MIDSKRSLFPLGARGLTIGDFSLILARDKLVVPIPRSGMHFTLHGGANSGTIDLHVTDELSKAHLCLFSIKQSKFEAAAVEFAQDSLGIFTILHKLRPGWMVRHSVAGVLGLDPAESEFGEVGELRRGRFRLDQSKLAARVVMPDDPADLYDLPDGTNFTLICYRNANKPTRIGSGWKVSRGSRPRLFWGQDRKLRLEMRRIGPKLLDLMVRHGEIHTPLPWTIDGLVRLVKSIQTV